MDEAEDTWMDLNEFILKLNESCRKYSQPYRFIMDRRNVVHNDAHPEESGYNCRCYKCFTIQGKAFIESFHKIIDSALEDGYLTKYRTFKDGLIQYKFTRQRDLND